MSAILRSIAARVAWHALKAAFPREFRDAEDPQAALLLLPVSAEHRMSAVSRRTSVVVSLSAPRRYLARNAAKAVHPK